MPNAPYTKLLDVPLRAPDTSVPLMAKQLPENILWLPDGRGFQKRPGSLPFAYASVNPGETNFICSLALGQMPASKLSSYQVAQSDGEMVMTSQILLSYRWGFVNYQSDVDDTDYPRYGIFQIDPYRAFLLSRASTPAGGVQLFSRSREGRDDEAYYFGNDNTATEIGSEKLIYDMYALLSPSGTSYTGASQQNLRARTLRPESLNPSLNQFSLAQKPYVVSQPTLTRSGGSRNTPFNAINTERIDFVSTEEGIFVGGGGGPVMYFDGDRTAIAGAIDLNAIAAGNNTGGQTFNMDGGDNGAGALTGVYKYIILHVVTLPSGEVIYGEPYQVQGDGSGITITVAAEKIGLFTDEGQGLVGAYNWDYMYRANGANVVYRLYRTKAGGDIYYKRADFTQAQLPGTALILDDNAADSTLGEEYLETAYSRFPSPASTHAITLHQGRLVTLTTGGNPLYHKYGSNSAYLADENLAPFIQPILPTIYYSPASSYHYWPAENSFNIPVSDGSQKPVALVSINDILYIFMSGSIYYVTGTLGEVGGFTVNLLTDQVGCRDPRSVIKIGSTVYFVSQQGLTALQGTALDFNVGKQIRRFLLEQNVITSCHYWRTKNLLLVSANKMVEYKTGDASTRFFPEISEPLVAQPYRYYCTSGTPRTFVLDLTNMLWSVWDIECFNGAVDYLGDLICAPSIPHPDGQDNELFFTRYSDNCNWTDDGRPFTARYFSEWFDGGMPVLDKQFNRLAIFSNDNDEAGGQGFGLSIHTERDWIHGTRVQDFELDDFETPGYGSQPYGSQPYGDPSRPYKVIPLGNQKVKSMRVVLENSEPNGNFSINAVALETTDTYDNSKDS